MRSYVAILLATSAALLLLIGTFNWLVDPYWIFRGPSIPGFNALKPAIPTNQRIFETVSVSEHPPRAVILGTSRADVGLDPAHPAFARISAFNLATSGQPIYETARLFRHLLTSGQLRSAVIALDFSAFNVYESMPADFDEANFQSGRVFKLLFSAHMLEDSVRTIFGQNRKAILTQRGLYLRNGLRAVTFDHIAAKGGHRRAFLENEASYLTPSQRAFKLQDGASGKSALNCLRTILALAYRHKIDMRLLISPTHARQLETVAALGLWPTFEAWERALVSINEEEARRADAKPFPLWDFIGYNSVTTEAVPPLGDKTTQMRGYWESSHYKKEVGDWVLDRLYGIQNAPRVPDDFGVLLNSDTLDSHLVQLRDGRQRYMETHHADVEEIQRMAKKALPTASEQGGAAPKLLPANGCNSNINSVEFAKRPGAPV